MDRIIILSFLLGALSASAERIGNFDIDATVTHAKETTQSSGSSNYKEKDQTITYKVKIDCRGTEKYSDLVVKYIVLYRVPRYASVKERGDQLLSGEEKIPSLAPLGKFEFSTKSVSNTYTQYGTTSEYQWGKMQFKGIALKLMQGDKVIAEFSRPVDMKDRWKDADKE